MSLYLRYHPTTLAGVVGHAAVIASIRRILKTSDREAFWFAGPSGCGKTTIAQALASEFCDKRDVMQIAGTKCGVDIVEEIEQNFYYSTWGESGWKAVIVNEAHKITDRAVDAWLTLLDPDASGAFRHKRMVLFTSTSEFGTDLFGSSTSPFARRCKQFVLKPDLQAFAEYAKNIAEGEELNGGGWGVDAFMRRLKASKGNLGALLQDIECGVFMEPSPEPVVKKQPELVAVGVSEFDAACDELIAAGRTV